MWGEGVGEGEWDLEEGLMVGARESVLFWRIGDVACVCGKSCGATVV